MHSLDVITIPHFFRKRKQRTFRILSSKEEIQKAFVNLGDTSIDSDETVAKIESFVCTMYGSKVNSRIDGVKYHVFLRNTGFHKQKF